MIRRDDFIEALGAPDPGFDAAVNAALLRVKESEGKPVMKKKMSLTILLAAAFVLALTGTALAVGFNLFDYFGKFDRRLRVIAPEAAVEDDAALEVDTDALGTVRAKIDSAYYDGQSLIVAYTLENFRRYTPYTPTSDELAAMSREESFHLEPEEADSDQLQIVESLRRAIDAGEPMGLIEYTVYPGDHSYTDDGVDLQPSSATEEIHDGGLLYCIREYETPLPKAAQNRDCLALRMPMKLFTSWYYFDGQSFYERYAQTVLGDLTATVKRTDAITRAYSWEGETSGARVKAEAQISAVHAKLRIEIEDGAFPDPAELWPEVAQADDTWYSFELLDQKKMPYRFSESTEGEGVVELEYDGLGYLPDAVFLTVQLEGEGDWDADAHVLPGFPVMLKPE